MDRFLRFPLVSGSQAVGHADIDSASHANKKSGKQRDQKAGRPNRSQRPVIREAAHHSHIA